MWHDPGVPLAFPVESVYSGDATGTPEFFPTHAGKGFLLSGKEEETGLLWMWAGLSCFLSSADGYVRELPELGGSPGEGTGCPLQYSWASLVAELVKILPATRETWV